MFVDFMGHPYPQIYVSSNLYSLIKISKHHLLSFNTVFRYTGNITDTLNTVITF